MISQSSMDRQINSYIINENFIIFFFLLPFHFLFSVNVKYYMRLTKRSKITEIKIQKCNTACSTKYMVFNEYMNQL